MADKNILAQLGWNRDDITDADFEAEFGVSRDDPAFNKKIFDAVEQMNYDNYLAAGMSPEVAKKRAAERKAMAMKNLPKGVKM